MQDAYCTDVMQALPMKSGSFPEEVHLS